MTSIVTRLRAAAAKRSAYNRTVFAIESMPLDTALDLDIYRDDARKIAYRAVYGA